MADQHPRNLIARTIPLDLQDRIAANTDWLNLLGPSSIREDLCAYCSATPPRYQHHPTDIETPGTGTGCWWGGKLDFGDSFAAAVHFTCLLDVFGQESARYLVANQIERNNRDLERWTGRPPDSTDRPDHWGHVLDLLTNQPPVPQPWGRDWRFTPERAAIRQVAIILNFFAGSRH